MRRIIYDFAMSVDGFIGHFDGTIDGFVAEGDHVTDYLARLEGYDTVLMGRGTYEFGYQFGLKPGDRAYAHMEHYIFSDTLQLDSSQVNVVGRDRLDLVRELKTAEGNDIYLCGGGIFAQALLEQQLIDQLVIKLNPAVFGEGIRAFGDSDKSVQLALLDSKAYRSGVSLLRYDVKYG